MQVSLAARALPPAASTAHCSEAYERVLHERSGTAEDVSVLGQAQTSLGRCGRQWARCCCRTPGQGLPFVCSSLPADGGCSELAPSHPSPHHTTAAAPQHDQGPAHRGPRLRAGGARGRGRARRARAVRRRAMGRGMGKPCRLHGRLAGCLPEPSTRLASHPMRAQRARGRGHRRRGVRPGQVRGHSPLASPLRLPGAPAGRRPSCLTPAA